MTSAAQGFADPSRPVLVQAGYLETVSALSAVAAYKQMALELLAPRPGETILDAGCGLGDDARRIAGLVGDGGLVIGIDASPSMIEEARVRTAPGDGLAVEWRVGDVHRLAMESGTVDACRADRVLQHVEDPARAIAEIARVTARGGRVLLSEPDWGTLVIAAPGTDDAARGALVDLIRSRIRNPAIGASLPGLMRRAGLEVVTVVPACALMRTIQEADAVLELEDAFGRMRDAGVGARAVAGLRARLAAASDDGALCAMLSGLLVLGHRP